MDQKLQTLLTLATRLNYTKTAEELNLTQPAVTHHIKQLEWEYEIKIFVKDGKRLAITPDGSSFKVCQQGGGAGKCAYKGIG